MPLSNALRASYTSMIIPIERTVSAIRLDLLTKNFVINLPMEQAIIFIN